LAKVAAKSAHRCYRKPLFELFADVPLCALVVPKAARPLSAHFQPFVMTFKDHGFRDFLGAL
jgi:hypothetical protein